MVELLSRPRNIAEADAPKAMLGGPPGLRSLRSWLAAWASTCATCWGALALYEDLNRLSDAELARRGLSRTDLARDVIAACDPAKRHPTD